MPIETLFENILMPLQYFEENFFLSICLFIFLLQYCVQKYCECDVGLSEENKFHRIGYWSKSYQMIMA